MQSSDEDTDGDGDCDLPQHDSAEMGSGAASGPNPATSSECGIFQAENAGAGVTVSADTTAENLCQLSGSMMTDPIKTPYGHVFDRQALQDWLQFSETDPICGQPLNMADCVPYVELQNKIFQDQLNEISGAVLGVPDHVNVPTNHNNIAGGAQGSDCQIPHTGIVPDVPSAQGPVSTNCNTGMENLAGVTGPESSPSNFNPALLGDLPSLKKEEAPKKKKEKCTIKIASRSLIDAPPNYRCEIDGKVMTNPIRTPYGNKFEKKTLEKWIDSCGSVCPITSQPLRFDDCHYDKELKHEIVAWLKENMNKK